MMRFVRILLLLLLAVILQQCSYSQSNTRKKQTMDTSKKDSINKNKPVYSRTDAGKVNISEEEWKKILPADIYAIARQKGTERPWTSQYEHSKEVGTYY